MLATLARLALLLAAGYAALCLLAVVFRNRLVFPIRGGVTFEPSRIGIPDGKRVTIETGDGERLAAWWLPPRGDGPSGAVIWFHGNAETVAGIGPILREFRPEHAGLLAVEYRGYAGSTGSTTIDGTLLDAEAAWDWLTRLPDVDSTRIVVYGRSVGSGPAAHLAAVRPAAGLILESPFSSLRAMARVHYPLLPSALAGAAFDNLATVERSSAPLLVINGDRDDIVPPAMGRALAERAGARASLWTIPGAGHNDTYDIGGDEYLRRFREFVRRHTSGSSDP